MCFFKKRNRGHESDKPVKTDDGTGRVIYFSFHNDGTIGGDTYNYTVGEQDGKFIFTYEHMMLRDYGEMKAEMSAEQMDALQELYRRHDLSKWDGFDKFDRNVCDGSGFSLYVNLSNGFTMRAHGMNEFPKGFREFCRDMEAVFKPICDRLTEEKRKELVAAGFSGRITSFFAHFLQKGKSGSDSYDVQVSQDGTYMRAEWSSEDRLFADMPRMDYTDSGLELSGALEKLTELVRKHNIISWYDWDKAAEDYNNEEWFQISFNFEEGRINAHGTLHPEGYDAFRKDFLVWLLKTVKENYKE